MSVRVVDPVGAAGDPALPTLAGALDPAKVERSVLPLVAHSLPHVQELREIVVTRHKPGRRCLVVYRFDDSTRVYGKLRARGADRRTHDLMVSLWEEGFRVGGERAAAVPQPIAVLPDLHMTLQRAVPGRLVTEGLAGGDGVTLMARVAEAIHALHGSGVTVKRRHTLADELRILSERLAAVAAQRPEWAQRVDRVLDACRRAASRLTEPRCATLHRDFYPDQLIENEGELTLLDLDLCALGDPALDVGNFSAHLTEHALRHHADPMALGDQERALEEAYLSLAGDVRRETIRTYAALTLARHISISTLLPDRNGTTPELIALCEQRLGIRSSGAVAATPDRRTCPPRA